MKGVSLQDFRDMFSDVRINLAIGQVLKITISNDFAEIKCLCRLVVTDNRELVATMTWPSVGPQAGDYQLPSTNDLVLIGFCEGNEDMAFVISRLSSIFDKIPKNALEGDRVIKSLPSKSVWVTGQEKIFLSKTDEEPEENLVLGKVFKKLMEDLIKIVDDLITAVAAETTPTHVGPYAAIKLQLDALKSSPLADDKVLSSYAYTSED